MTNANPNQPNDIRPPIDRAVLKVLATIAYPSIHGRWHRQNDPRYPLTSIAARVDADARWRQRGDVGVLHFSDSGEATWAELHRTLDPDVDPTLVARCFGSVEVHLRAVLDLTDTATAAALQCGSKDLLGPHGPRCPAIARAAEHARLDAIVAPSAARPGARTLVVFRHALPHVIELTSDPETYGPPRDPPP